jgi:glycosyltransferase involved in cell wall biosynthesis
MPHNSSETHAVSPVIHPECVSVVIPCYRQAQLLGEAIESVLSQTHPHYEIIVVDDYSPDHAADVAERYPAVRYIRHARNAGPSTTRNTGIKHSSGRYLVFLDADDRLLPHHFTTALDVFRRQPDLALVCGDFQWFGSESTWHRHTCSDQPDHYAALLRFGFIAPPCTAMVTRDAVTAVGAFREDLRFNEDRDLWLRVTRRYPIHCHHQVVAEYRRHPDQLTQRWGVMLETGVSVMRDQRPFVQNNPVYAEALLSGVRQYQRACGPPLVWRMVGDLRGGRYRAALTSFWVLLRYYPQGFRELVTAKLRRLVAPERHVSERGK